MQRRLAPRGVARVDGRLAAAVEEQGEHVERAVVRGGDGDVRGRAPVAVARDGVRVVLQQELHEPGRQQPRGDVERRVALAQRARVVGF